MTNVSKHNTEKKGESYHIENCRVNFFIIWCTISHYNLVEWPHKFVHLKVCGWIQGMLANFFQVIFQSRLFFKCFGDFIYISFRYPEESSKILPIIYSEFIHCN